MKYMPSLMLIPHERLEVFLDISKAFDRVWHEGLIYKIKWMGLKGDLLALIESFLFKNQQRAVLNGQEPEWLVFFRVQLLVYCSLFFDIH